MKYYNPLSAKRYDFTLKQISKFANGRKLNILDIGCGMGNLSFPLAELGHNVVGLDEDEKLIKQDIFNNNYENLIFIHGDAHSLGKLGNFDVVILCEVLEHVTSPSKVVADVEKILKSDGILITEMTNGNSLSEIVLGRILSRNGKSNKALKVVSKVYCFITGTKMTHTHPFYLDDLHVNFFSLAKIKRLFSGFKIQTIENSDLGMFIAGTGRMVWLKIQECKLADHLPHSMVGGWMMVLKKNE